MISELSFIRSYNSFWNSLFPGGEDYIRLINSALGRRYASPLNIEDVASRRALINSVSFAFFEYNVVNGIPISQIESIEIDNNTLNKIINIERDKLQEYLRNDSTPFDISTNELMIIKNISKRLMFLYAGKTQLIVRPKFNGCGIIYQAYGDIMYGSTLTEIKSGNRNFSIQDIRQLYVYLALNYQQKQYTILEIELCNPRVGITWKENINVVSDNIAGAPTIEIYNEIINFVSNDARSI